MRKPAESQACGTDGRGSLARPCNQPSQSNLQEGGAPAPTPELLPKRRSYETPRVCLFGEGHDLLKQQGVTVLSVLPPLTEARYLCKTQRLLSTRRLSWTRAAPCRTCCQLRRAHHQHLHGRFRWSGVPPPARHRSSACRVAFSCCRFLGPTVQLHPLRRCRRAVGRSCARLSRPRSTTHHRPSFGASRSLSRPLTRWSGWRRALVFRSTAWIARRAKGGRARRGC